MNNNVEYDYADDLRGEPPAECDVPFFKGLLWAFGILAVIGLGFCWTMGWL